MTKKTTKTNNIRFAFFGTAPLAEGVLKELGSAGLTPERIVESTHITPQFVEELKRSEWDVFVVASYGKIIPPELLKLPRHGVINVHPSLLPRFRGPSPIRSAILHDEQEVGVSIMLLDDEIDHGPLIAQKKVAISSWPPHGRALDLLLADEGGKLLAQMLPKWVAGDIEARPQNHDVATYCEAFKKEDGLLNLSAHPYQNLLKIRALEGWPGTYVFFERGGKKLRVQILDAHLDPPAGGGKLIIDKVKPEGKREMSYEEFLRSGAIPLTPRAQNA